MWVAEFGFSAMALARTRMPRSTWVPAGVMIWPLLDDEGAVRLRAGDVGRERHGLTGERRSRNARRQQAGQRTQTLDSRLIPRFFSRHASDPF